MTDAARIREKRQLTIPARVRREARLHAGSIVELEVVEGGSLLTPLLIVAADQTVGAAFAPSMVRETGARYAALRDDPHAWAAELEEGEVFEGSLGDAIAD
jgi:AbrB family looped-hinge helix DNA binding protein